MRKFLVIMPLILTCGSALADTPVDKVMEAFNNDKAVRTEIERIRNEGHWNKEEIEKVNVSGDCGAAGCNYKTLVIMRFKWQGTNSRSRSLFAVVDSSKRKGRTVTLVDLVPRGTASKAVSDGSSNQPLEPIR